MKEIIKLLEGMNKNNSNIKIEYIAPYNEADMEIEGLQFIFLQAVMEHVDNALKCYKTMNKVLRIGGYISHDIDLSAHNTSNYWNGHWAYPVLIWKLICGNRHYSINRLTASQHVDMVRKSDFGIINIRKNGNVICKLALSYKKLAYKFKKMSEDVFNTANVYIFDQKIKTN